MFNSLLTTAKTIANSAEFAEFMEMMEKVGRGEYAGIQVWDDHDKIFYEIRSVKYGKKDVYRNGKRIARNLNTLAAVFEIFYGKFHSMFTFNYIVRDE